MLYVEVQVGFLQVVEEILSLGEVVVVEENLSLER